MGRRRMKNYNPMAIAESPMTAPDSRDSVERVVAEMREQAEAAAEDVTRIGKPALEVERVLNHYIDRLQALARGPQQAGGEDVGAAVERLRKNARNAFNASSDADTVIAAFGALQAEVARLLIRIETLRSTADRATVRADDAEAALREESARLDCLDERGEAYGFESTHEGNRWLIEGAYPNLRAAIDAALNGGQDDA